MQETNFNLIQTVVFQPTQEHNQLPCENGRWTNEIIMETLRDYLHHRNYNLRKVDCDPLRKIKRRIGYILLEEFCSTSDEQLLDT